MDKIEKAFADYFRNWDICLPPGASTLKQPGQIRKAGWFISYVFGDNYLDFFANHRMTNPRHERIHADGRIECLDTYWEFRVAGEEEEFYVHNRKVSLTRIPFIREIKE